MTDNERCDPDEGCLICNTIRIRLPNINELHHNGPLLDPATRHRAEDEYYDD